MTRIQRARAAIRKANDALEDAVMTAFPPGKIVHREHGQYRIDCEVLEVYKDRVKLLSHTGKVYWAYAYLLEGGR